MDLNSSDGGAAFARPYSECEGDGYQDNSGMSLEDYFAAAALTGLLARGKDVIDEKMIRVHSRMAWKIAEEMIEVRQDQK